MGLPVVAVIFHGTEQCNNYSAIYIDIISNKVMWVFILFVSRDIQRMQIDLRCQEIERSLKLCEREFGLKNIQ